MYNIPDLGLEAKTEEIWAQWAYDVKLTSYRRRYDVMTSYRRRYDVMTSIRRHFGTKCPLGAHLKDSKLSKDISAGRSMEKKKKR